MLRGYSPRGTLSGLHLRGGWPRYRSDAPKRPKPRPRVVNPEFDRAIRTLQSSGASCAEKVTCASRLIELGGLKRRRVATAIVSSLGRCGEAARALDALACAPSPNTFTYNAAIHACRNNARGGVLWERAIELLRRMHRCGVAPDVVSYNSTISACEKAGQWERALELLSEMQEHGLEPDVISYSATISACEKGGEWRRALELFNEMRRRRPEIEPNSFIYNAMISACEKARGGAEWQCAIELLDEMTERGIEPDVISYSAAISACEKGGEWQRALELLDAIRRRGLAPNVISYSAAISACEKGGEWRRALELFAEMRFLTNIEARTAMQCNAMQIQM